MARRSYRRAMSSTAPQPEVTTEEVIEAGLADTPGAKLIIAAALMQAEQRGLMKTGKRKARVLGPQTDEELLDAVLELTGVRIPRNTVCVEHGHVAPAKTFCDLYFERARNVLWIGNRGGGKTANSGILHGAKGYWNENYSSALAGAIEKQAHRGYAEFRRFTRQLGDAILDSLMSKTNWANGTVTEVIGGTVRQLNGPHPYFAQLDEVELSSNEAYQEFLNMAQGDAFHMAQQLLTSTRKKAHGLVQQIVKEVDAAIKDGVEPPFRVDIFCVFETMQQVPNCRTAPENADRPESELCECHLVRKGEWEKGKPRTFDQVCGGRAYRADGFVRLDDVHSRFRALSQAVWEAQQECLRPSTEGLVHKWYDHRYRLDQWQPHPMFGPIYRGWDWGGENPHAIVWLQRLTNDVAIDIEGNPLLDEHDEDFETHRVLKAGSIIQFDEIFGNAQAMGEFSTLGIRASLRLLQWHSYGFPIQIEGDYCDPAGLVAKREVRKAVAQLAEAVDQNRLTSEHLELMAHYGIDPEELTGEMFVPPSFKSPPVPREESIRKHIELGTDGLIYLVEAMCPNTGDEYDVYHWEEPKEGKNLPEDAAKVDDHSMDAKRYAIWSIVRGLGKAKAEQPQAAVYERRTPMPEPAPVGSKFGAPRTAPSQSPLVAPDDGLPGYLRGAPHEQSVRRTRIPR